MVDTLALGAIHCAFKSRQLYSNNPSMSRTSRTSRTFRTYATNNLSHSFGNIASYVHTHSFHASELIFRIGSVVIAWIRTSIVLFVHRDSLIQLTLSPLNQTHRRLSWLDPTELIVLGVSRSMIVSVVVVYPLIMRHIWLFLVPGLRVDEAKAMKSQMFGRLIALYSGIFRGTYYRVPFSWAFFNSFSEGISNVDAHPRISLYFEWYIRWVMWTVFRTHIPMFMNMRIASKWRTVQGIVNGRRYIVFGSFLLGARVTPPDVISQCIVAITIIVLVECIIFYHIRLSVMEQAKTKR